MRFLKIAVVLVVAVAVSAGCASRGRGACCVKRYDPGPCAPPVTGIRFFNKTSRPVIVKADAVVLGGYDFKHGINGADPDNDWFSHTPALLETTIPGAITTPLAFGVPIENGLAFGAFPNIDTFEPSVGNDVDVPLRDVQSGYDALYTTEIQLTVHVDRGGGAMAELDTVVLKFTSPHDLDLDFDNKVMAVITERPDATGQPTYAIDLFVRYRTRTNSTTYYWAHTSASTTLP